MHLFCISLPFFKDITGSWEGGGERRTQRSTQRKCNLGVAILGDPNTALTPPGNLLLLSFMAAYLAHTKFLQQKILKICTGGSEI